MNAERERTLLEASRRSPFWICLVVFVALAVDGGFRLFRALDQRQRLDQARLNQAAVVGRASQTLAQLPQVEAKLQAISVDLIQLARTNAVAAQLVREFNISWTPGRDASPTLGTAPTNAPAPAK